MIKVLLFLIFLEPFLSLADPIAANWLPITVTAINVPWVSVKICAPGTPKCQTIDKIKLDTGSSGLRIYQSAITLNLNTVQDQNKNPIATCMHFGGGSSMWGNVKIADVVLGNERAANVPIQVVDDPLATRPSGCPESAKTLKSEGANGILGISPALIEELGETYYTCFQDSCLPAQDTQTAFKIQNPIPFLPSDNNGATIVFPPVAQSGQPSVVGSLFLGVGTRSNNTPPAQVRVCKTGPHGFFYASLNGRKYWSMIDSGTNAYNLPSDVQVGPHCSTWGASFYLCLGSRVTLTPTLLNFDGSVCATESLEVGPSSPSPYLQGMHVISALSMQWGGETSRTLNLGLPFFYGKTIYTVIDGKSSALGPGPWVGF